MQIIDGRKIAQKVLVRLKEKINKLGTRPGLAVILVGANPASLLYVRNKKRAAEKIGIKFNLYKYRTNVANKTLISQIKKLNKQKDINGIIVQLPLPKKLNTGKIIFAIDPKKDVDGFHPKSYFISPVAQAVIALLEATKKNLKNKKAILFVKSETFAKPIKKLLENKGAKVQIIFTPSLEEIKREASKGDIIITALGKPGILRNKMIKDGAIVIDVGITPISSPYPRQVGTGGVRKNVKFVGDLDPRNLEKKKGFYTPVPGGVGPATVAMLLKNVIAAQQNNPS